MKIKVTEDHIKRAVKGNNKSCPVALACKDAFSEGDIEVTYFCQSHDINLCRIVLPQRIIFLQDDIAQKIFQYDKTGNMEPFEFEVD